ncbi:LysM peptidoglycan-binding domain-containing protein [Pseudaminobacter soli (ex Li et al. 2025)]|uniref:Peptigoglycan-binding protein LysM n=1 Tax=Pseudaminobacter soli (ex Li et al. 2025) TaxID=1295366 RepID=A0A2P7SFI7_9HYPH|nr:LysM peptidoglycan-binding domain-containing protein [Mesorhizobium soli]PSJ61259.1 peptigoglycan-binding protein LysM [Mesorhizobium soli]
MARGMNRALLFLAGGVAAAAITAYVMGALDPYIGKKTEAAVSSPEATAPQPEAKEARLPAQPQAETAKAPEATAPATTEQQAATEPTQAPAAQTATAAGAEVQAPSFDIVRAEGDGSLVIAGKAAANAKVEIILGAKVIGNAVAGPEGDFAVALDEPLKPGDHQIVLRSTSPDNVVATSPETAVVSIPEDKNGQVLALVEQPGAPSKLISVPEPEAKSQAEQAPNASEEAAKPAETAAATEPAAQKPGQQASAETGQPADQAAPAAAATGAAVKVEAVEIEGRKVFVAGSADPGRKVRVYANDILLGEVATSPGGRFLIETERDLPVGDYIIRADALEQDGVKVAARAAVPFEREAGEAQAAVAPAAAEQPAAATEPAKAAPATETAASAEPAKPAGSTEVAAAAPEKMSPKLQNVDGAVIIRRGDSLWRISRRVYGLGVRYSTIYLANQDQIRNPDRIWPGQVFKVPEKTHEGEAANMKAVGEQATTLPQ